MAGVGGKGELNFMLPFRELTPDQARSFRPAPAAVLIRLAKGVCLYKWTSYPLFSDPAKPASEYWINWEPIKLPDGRCVPGFEELRNRYRNAPGEAGQPRDMARARKAVTLGLNPMDALLKAQLLEPVWGFVGICASQPFSTRKHLSNVVWIGGDYQLVIPNMSRSHIRQL